MSPPRNPRVVIAGAGPVGLTLALLLGARDISVTVLEAEDKISEELRASTFHPPTLDMLAPYGITDRMLEQGLLCPTWQVRLHPSGARAVFDLSVLKGDTDYPYRLQCEQSKYAQIVFAALAAFPNIDIQFSTAVSNIRQLANSVEIEATSHGEPRVFAASYVIGADGARSAVRKALGIELSGDIYPETTILATTLFPFHKQLEGLSNVTYCWKPDGTFSLLRLPGVWRTSLYAREGQSVEDALTDEGLRSLLRDIVPDQTIDVLERRPYRIHRRLATKYREGRALLAGDAAHLNSPSGGMGMNGGIHDAFNLAEKLSAVLCEGADETLLDRYERQRRPVAEEEIIQQAHRNRTRMQERDPVRRRELLADLQRTADDPVKLKAYLLKILNDRWITSRRGDGMKPNAEFRMMPTCNVARRWFVLAACGLALPWFAAPSIAQAEAYPSHPITVIVPFPAGGSSDIVMRLLGQKVSESIGQPVIIDNRPGGAGNAAALTIKNAAPDGYLLMMGHTGTHAINPTLYPDLKFDPVKDFTPITSLVSFNNILVVPAASPAKSVAELVALAKAKPEGLLYGSQGIGTGGHLLGVLLAKHSGAKLEHVPYRGIAPAVTDTVAGRVDMLFSSYLSAAGHIQSGGLRMLAIAGDKRHPRIPDVPTMPEAGYPDVQMQQWFGLFGPPGMPPEIVQKLNTEFVRALQSDEVKNQVLPQVANVIPSTPEELRALVATDMVRLGKIVKESGATVQ